MFSFLKRNKEPKKSIQRVDEYGYLGKTSLRPDFIKHQINSREAIALDHWVKEGFAFVSREKSTVDYNSDDHGLTNLFFMAGNENEASLLGVITPSIDSSGRYYPFVDFVNVGQEVYRSHPSGLFLHETPCLQQLLTISDEIFVSSSLDDMVLKSEQLNQVINSLKSPVQISQLLEQFRTIPMSDLWDAVGIDDIEKRALLIQESSLIMKSMSNKGCLRSQVALRFPMPIFSEKSAIVAAFWCHLMTVMVADHNWRPWLFYQIGKANTAASLTVFATPMPASSFASIWQVEHKNQSVIDLANISASQPLSTASLSLAEMNNVSMYDALRRWCKG